MARRHSIGFETGSLTVGHEFLGSVTGTVSIDSSTVRSGSYSMRANPTASTGYITPSIGGFVSAIGVRAYIYISTAPSAQTKIIGNNVGSGGVYLNTDRTLTLKDNGAIVVGSASPAVPLNTWTRVEFLNNNATYYGSLEGTQFASGGSTGGGSYNAVQVGIITSCTTDVYFDDIAIDNTTAYPGEGSIVHLYPNASGSNNAWLKSGGGAGTTTNYQDVDEVLPDDNTSYLKLTTTSHNGAVDLYNLQGFTTDKGLSSSSTINLVSPRYRVYSASYTNGWAGHQPRIYDGTSTTTGSTTYPSSAATWTTFQNASGTIGNYPQAGDYVLTTKPSGGTWTPTVLDSTQLGMVGVISPFNSEYRATQVYLLVEYIAPSITTTTRTQTGVARIGVVVSQGQTGVSNITLPSTTTTKTQTGVSRVTATTTRTQAGVANIRNDVTRTQTGAASLVFTTARTQNGRSSVNQTASTTNTYQDVASSDDATENLGTLVTLNDTTYTWDGVGSMGIRIPGVAVAQGTTITEARFFFDELLTYSGGAAVNGTLYGHDVDNSSTFTTTNGDISTRTRTSASTTALSTTVGNWKTTGIDVTSIVQEIVDRGGWSSGNAITLLFIGAGTSGTSVTPYLLDYSSGLYKANLSITTGGGSVAYTRYQYGVANIIANSAVTQDQTGKARIALVITQDQTGKARITAATSQTQDGKARITVSTSRDQTGVSRITATTSRTQDGKASVLNAVPRTQTGVSRINNTATRDQTGISRITVTTPRTQAGISRTTVTTSRDQTGLSRVTSTTTRDQLGKANLVNAVTRDQTGLSKITAVTTRDQLGKGDILNTTTQTQTGKGRVEITTLQTITGVARISVATDRTQTGVSRVTATTTRDQLGKGAVLKTQTQDQTGKARLTQTVLQTITGVSRITQVVSRTVDGLSRITAAVLRAITGLSRITIVSSQNIQGTARVTAVSTQNQTGLAKITATTTQNQDGKGQIGSFVGRDQTGTARITQTSQQAQTGISRITVTTLQTQTGLGRITLTATRDQTGLARITAITTRDQNGTSRVTLTTTQDQTGVANLNRTVTQDQTGLSMVAGLVTRDQTGKTRITVSGSEVQFGKARVVIPIVGLEDPSSESYRRFRYPDDLPIELSSNEEGSYTKLRPEDTEGYDEIVSGPTPSWPS